MRLLTTLLAFTALSASAQVVPGHRLPEGTERPVREREAHIQRYRADLRFDMAKEEISGAAAVTFTPLRSGLKELSLDAADLTVTKVTLGGASLKFEARERKLKISLPAPAEPGESMTVSIAYSCRPKTGMYFFPKSGSRGAQAWNYGEGGLHYGWLPIYSDTNDRFPVEWNVTVAKPFVAVANGVLKQTRENPDGTRTFSWVQEKPIPGYLMTVDVGELSRVPLDDARLGAAKVPLAAWTSPGTEEAARFAFRNTPRMVEFYSELFRYPYPWDKYDQVVLREFSVGAMETTSATGFMDPVLRREADPADDQPQLTEAWATWGYEDTVSHELAHHWFGDLVTCRSLGSIWLNESFATFLHTLWTGKAHGEDDLTYQRWRYLDRYLSYVHETGTVRPMEFFRYTVPQAMYQQDATYIKGSLVLHMLRHFTGDADFFRTLSAYLKAHEYGTVDSNDLLAAFERTCGRNLSWFFDDWIRGGAGHPALDVSYRWVPERKAVDLSVTQLQADLPFENDFRLPVDVEVVTASGAKTHKVALSGWSTHVSLPADGKPSTVVFDKGGWLVAEVRYVRPLEDLLGQLSGGGLADRLRAARQLATDFARLSASSQALARLLADPKEHWGLRQEAARDLGAIGTSEATAALVFASADPDRRLRRAAALALGQAGSKEAETALRKLVETDAAEDVVGTAELSLGRLRASGAKDFLTKQLSRASRWCEAVRLGAIQGLALLGDPALAPTFAPYTAEPHDQRVRVAALDGWFRSAPDDPRLAPRLRELANDRNRQLREEAIPRLGALHRPADLPFLKDLATTDADPNIAGMAREAAEEIERFTKGTN